jgi:UDP-N-acetylglucosamine--dolichyl-phosphate N-acetylglucosaminephosphotransferase
MFITIGINLAISVGIFLATRRLIPNLKAMFLKANLYGIDMSKKDKVKV